MTWLERILWLAVIALVIWFFRSCSGGSIVNPPVTVIKIDTFWREFKADTVYIPKITSVTNTKWRTDTLETFEVRIDPADTAAILAQYFEKVAYDDVQSIQYGTVTISDTVTQNRVVSRRLSTSLNIPEITKTVTIRDRRAIGYVGLGIMGNSDNPLYGAGIDFSLKFKNDWVYSAGYMHTRDNNSFITIGAKKPIRLKR